MTEREKNLLTRLTQNATIRSEPDTMFRLWQEAGRIPREYQSWDHLSEVGQAYVSAHKKQGSTVRAEAIMQDLGINFIPTVENKSIFDAHGRISNRAVDDAIHPAVQVYANKAGLQNEYSVYEDKRRYRWKVTHKETSNELRDASGQKAARGHVRAGMFGGGLTLNVAGQHNTENSILREGERLPTADRPDWGFADDHMQEFSEFLINPIDDPNYNRALMPVNGPDTLIEVDRTRQPNLKAPPQSQAPGDYGRPQDYDGALARAQRIYELRKQGVNIPIQYRGDGPTATPASPAKVVQESFTDGATRVNPGSGRPEIFDKAKGKWRSQVVDLGSAAPTLPNEIGGNPSIFGVTPEGAAIQQAGKLINKNRLGALAGAGFGGTDREVGKKLGQGDYRGAAIQLGTNATIGAAGEAALKAGSKSLLKALAKRAPALASRVVAGSAASGGLLAPALAAYGIYDIADGLVEGATGRGISQRVVDSGALNTGKVSTKPATAQQTANRTSINNRINARTPAAIPTTSKPRIKPILTGKLSAAQIRTFQAGGGQAAMLRDGFTREQVIERGSALLLKQKYG